MNDHEVDRSGRERLVPLTGTMNFRDYELTTTYRSQRRIEELRPTFEAAGVDIEAVRAYLSAERTVLAATLDHLRARWGSIEDYLIEAGGSGPRSSVVPGQRCSSPERLMRR